MSHVLNLIIFERLETVKGNVIYLSFCLLSVFGYMSRIWYVLFFFFLSPPLQLTTLFTWITREKRHKGPVTPQPSKLWDQAYLLHNPPLVLSLRVYLCSSRTEWDSRSTIWRKVTKRSYCAKEWKRLELLLLHKLYNKEVKKYKANH